MEYINLTPHAIVLVNGELDYVFEPSGSIARVSVTTETLPSIGAEGFRLQKQVFGTVENLPEPKDGTVFIVSALVLAQCKSRDDVVAPDTGKDAIRNDQNQIVAVRGFVCP